MAERKKFSELASLTSITGNEIIPVGYNGDNFKATLNALKEFFGELKVQVFTELVTASVSVVQGYPSAETGAIIDVAYLTSRQIFVARKVVNGGNPSYYAQWNGYDNYMSDGEVRQDIAFVCLTDTYVYTYDGTSLSTRSHGGGGGSVDPEVITRIETLESTISTQGYQIGQTQGNVQALQQRASTLEEELSQEVEERTRQVSTINGNIASLNEGMASVSLSTIKLAENIDAESERALAAEAQIAAEAAAANDATNERVDQANSRVDILDEQSVKSSQVRTIIMLTEEEFENLKDPIEGALYGTYEE